jgi:DNA polymerase III delta prime subunit
MSVFKKAERKQAKLRLGLTGPSGSGKTYAALVLARNIGKKVAVIDTENGSASLYTHLADFDVIDMQKPYSPERFIEYIKAAEAGGYDCLIIDSITHEWSGPGGCIEINETLAASKYRGNTWSAWSETTPRHRKMLDAIVASPMHIIVTLRSKTETAQVEDGGRKKVIKLGMKTEQRDGFEYEMSVVLDIVHEGHFAVASKDRTGLFTDCDPAKITDDTAKRLMNWLNSGAELKPEPPAPAEKSAAYNAAKDALDKCKTVDDVKQHEQRVSASVRLSDTEKADLLKLCQGCIEAMS